MLMKSDTVTHRRSETRKVIHAGESDSSGKITGMPLLSGATPGRSQFSSGKGRFTEPRSDFQSQRSLPWPVGEDKHDVELEYRAQQRTDPTNNMEAILPDMLYVEGNPDQFGPGPALVQEAPNRPSGPLPQPRYRYGVNRQG